MNISIKNLVKSYEGKKILDIEQLKFESKKTYCIQGRNGTGKTTLLKIVANLLEADKGHILYNDKNIDKNVMKEMTYISQNPYMFNLNVYRNISYPIKIRSQSEEYTEDIVNYYLSYFELNHLRNQNAKQCSSGEKMKIALIRALIFKPKLLLLDEPTTNLDIESIEKVKETIINIKDDTTMIIVSHNKDFIKDVNDVCLKLNNTKIEMGDINV